MDASIGRDLAHEHDALDGAAIGSQQEESVVLMPWDSKAGASSET
jgi:hypothetical protein